VRYRWTTVGTAAARLDDVLEDELTAVTQLEHFEVQRHRRWVVKSAVHRLHNLLHFERVVRHTTIYTSHRPTVCKHASYVALAISLYNNRHGGTVQWHQCKTGLKFRPEALLLSLRFIQIQ